MTTPETGQQRDVADARQLITELIDEPTIESIAQDAWTAMVGADEVLVPLGGVLPVDPLPGDPLPGDPLPGDPLPGDVVSSWVEMTGPWTGTVVLTTGRDTAEDLTRALLAETAPESLEDEDVADALGELANVVGGNVKGALRGPSVLSLPRAGAPPAARNPADVCRVDVQWRGRPLAISVQGIRPPLPVSHADPGIAAPNDGGRSL